MEPQYRIAVMVSFERTTKEKLVMKRIETCTTSIALSCAMLAFAFGGCTSSDSAKTGGIEAQITLTQHEDTEQKISEVTVTISCDGDDPLKPNLPNVPFPTASDWETETHTVNVATSEGNNPFDPKPTVGIFKKEGLPPGTCDVQLHAVSDDGTTTCDGHMDNIPVDPGPQNTFRTIIVNCTSEARYGGIGINGEFNRCGEFEQIIVSPTSQTEGFDVDVAVECHDPDGDSMLADIRFVTMASYMANMMDPTMWLTCDTSIPNGTPGGPHYCDNTTPINTQVTCDASGQQDPTDPGFDPNNPWTYANCVATVAISDDIFASAGNNLEDGCFGYNYVNAFVTVPVFCAGQSICGNGFVEGAEACDPNGAGTSPGLPAPDPTDPGAGTWCGLNCQKFDPCDADPCAPDPADPCQANQCDSTGAVSCTVVNSQIPVGGDCGATNCANTFGNGCMCEGDAFCDLNGTPTGALCPNGNQDCGQGETCVEPLRTCESVPACSPEGGTGTAAGCKNATTCQTAGVCTDIGGGILSCVASTQAEGQSCSETAPLPGVCISGDCIENGVCVTTTAPLPLGANSTNLEAICPSSFNAFDPNYWNDANSDCGNVCQGIGGCVSNCLQGIPSTIFAYQAWDPNVNKACGDCFGGIQVCIADFCVWRLSDGTTNCAQGDPDCTASGPCAPPNDPLGAPCNACQAVNGCDVGFVVCAGNPTGACVAQATPPN